MNTIISLRGASKVYQKESAALKPLTVDIPGGQFIGIVGPDGAGKTTLLRLIAGLLLPTQGDITVDGYNTKTEAENIHNFLGYMPQKFGLYEDLSVIENMVLYADLQGIIKEEREQAFEKLFNFTHLKPFQKRRAGALSGGMKQKLGLACTLIRKPKLLLLDEPSVGVDPLSRRELWDMVSTLNQEGISVLWTTSYLDEAEKCKTILVFNEGNLIYNGSSKAFTERVHNRTFVLTTKDKHTVLDEMIRAPEVVDASIQGKDIRIVAQSADFPSLYPNYTVVDTPARLEDSFVDILGGCPKEASPLANKIAPIPKKEIVVEAKGLTKCFGNFFAATDISFSIPTGEIFGLLGPNGAGKSTTFKMLCGLLHPTRGTAQVNGFDLEHAPSQARSQLGYMAQKFSLYGNLSARANLQFFSGAYNMTNAVKKDAIDEMVDIFKLEPFLSHVADSLPLGFKQRLALACALMHRPPVVFLDEPTSGVDPITRREFWTHINGLVQKGVTIMVTTHFMDEAEYCDRIAIVYKSKVISMGTPDELKEGVRSELLPKPTLEDAFIQLIKQHDMEANGH